MALGALKDSQVASELVVGERSELGVLDGGPTRHARGLSQRDPLGKTLAS